MYQDGLVAIAMECVLWEKLDLVFHGNYSIHLDYALTIIPLLI